jgi:hypothetical protein
MLFKNPVRTSKRTPHFTITKINWLTLFNFNICRAVLLWQAHGKTDGAILTRASQGFRNLDHGRNCLLVWCVMLTWTTMETVAARTWCRLPICILTMFPSSLMKAYEQMIVTACYCLISASCVWKANIAKCGTVTLPVVIRRFCLKQSDSIAVLHVLGLWLKTLM